MNFSQIGQSSIFRETPPECFLQYLHIDTSSVKRLIKTTFWTRGVITLLQSTFFFIIFGIIGNKLWQVFMLLDGAKNDNVQQKLLPPDDYIGNIAFFCTIYFNQHSKHLSSHIHKYPYNLLTLSVGASWAGLTTICGW